MASDEIAERVKAAFARARQKLTVARHVLAGGYTSDAVSPAYYAAYHAAEAALLVEGDEPRSHEGLKSLFGLRFVSPRGGSSKRAGAVTGLVGGKQSPIPCPYPSTAAT